MFPEAFLALLLAFFSTFSAAVISAFVPVVNIELVLIAASVALPRSYAPVLILAATLGQMTGKSLMFFGGRGVKFLQRGRMKARIDDVGAMMQRRNGALGAMLFVSAATGLPPFYVVSVASGLTGVAFVQFATLGFLGRLVRFSIVVMFPQLIKALLN